MAYATVAQIPSGYSRIPGVFCLSVAWLLDSQDLWHITGFTSRAIGQTDGSMKCVCNVIRTDNPEILIIWHFEIIVPSLEVSMSIMSSSCSDSVILSWNWAHQTIIMASKGSQDILVFPDALSHPPSSFSALKSYESRKHRRGHWYPWNCSWRRHPNGHSCEQLSSPNVVKITCKNLGQCRYCLIVQHLSIPVGAGLKEFCCIKSSYGAKCENSDKYLWPWPDVVNMFLETAFSLYHVSWRCILT